MPCAPDIIIIASIGEVRALGSREYCFNFSFAKAKIVEGNLLTIVTYNE